MTVHPMRPPLLRLFEHEIIVDSFAGGGGASTGIEMALGRSPDIAINHDADAIAVHAANHPSTRHFREDVWKVDPVRVCEGRPVGLMWLSPDCRHFSKAKGAKPVEKKIRGLAWLAVHWAKTVAPRVIVLENVEEFAGWGPIGSDGRPDPLRKGLTFRRFVGRLRGLGYEVDWQEMVAADYGAPTSRKRLFLVARRDGHPIHWPEPTYGPGRALPWRTAAECIDWSLPCPSIFERQRPLAEATLRRIAAGVRRYVLEDAQPFLVPVTHTADARVFGVDASLRTITTAKGGEFALVAPTLIQTGYGERPGQAPRVPGLHKPLGTAVNGQKHALVSAFLAKHYGGVVGQRLGTTIGTVTARDHHSLVAALLIRFYGEGGQWARATDPMRTITTKDRMGLVLVNIDGKPYRIADIGMRMLQPRELFTAQGFPIDYIIDRGAYGEPITKEAQVRLAGNSVCPPAAAAVLRAQFAADQIALARRVA